MIILPNYRYNIHTVADKDLYIKIKTNSLEELHMISRFLSSEMFVEYASLYISIIVNSIEVPKSKEDIIELESYKFYMMAMPEKDSKPINEFKDIAKLYLQFEFGDRSYQVAVDTSSGELTHLS